MWIERSLREDEGCVDVVACMAWTLGFMVSFGGGVCGFAGEDLGSAFRILGRVLHEGFGFMASGVGQYLSSLKML